LPQGLSCPARKLASFSNFLPRHARVQNARVARGHPARRGWMPET
jgi:hypothetical protein